jgi:DnaJ like chaperone protein
MSYWGKLLGGVAGFALGGPMGAIMGAALGHGADSGGLGKLDVRSLLGGDPLNPAKLAASMGQRDQLFAIGVVVLSAKLAKADGPVNRAEIDAFKTHFRIPPESVRDIGRLFDQAREHAEGFEPYAVELGRGFVENKGLLEDVLTALFAIARADKPLTVAEHDMLRQVHHAFGLDNLAWDQARGAGRARSRAAEPVSEAYAILGATPAASPQELRAAWLRLVRENHPDSLAAKGVPAEFIARAGDKVARINAAWDRIKRERGL